MIGDGTDSLIKRGLLPRPEFTPCSACEMRSACSSARHCAHITPLRNQPHPRLSARLLSGKASPADLIEAARLLDIYAPDAL